MAEITIQEFEQVIQALEKGEIRVAEKKDGQWIVNRHIKEVILAGFKLGAKAVAASKKLKVKKHRAVKYESTDKAVATVTSKGVIKGKAKGTCFVYAYAQNGVSAKIKVTVK